MTDSARSNSQQRLSGRVSANTLDLLGIAHDRRPRYRYKRSAPPARTPAQHRVPPVNPIKHIGQLSCGDRHRAVSPRRPYKSSALQSFGVERQANPVVPENLDQLTAFAAEHIEIAHVRIALQYLLHLDRQAVHAAAHIGVPDRQPDPHPGRNRDHRRASALMIDAANAAGIDAGIRTRTFPANSTSTTGSAHTASLAALAERASGGAMNTWAKPFAALCNSCRQR